MDPRDIGSHIYAAGFAGARGVAAGTGDNTEVTTGAVDRQAVGQNCHSALAVIGGSATLAEGETLTIALNLQESSDNGVADAYADFGTAVAATVVLTGLAGGAKQNFTFQQKFDISSAERYLKLQFTPNCSASGTDTFEIAGGLILGGFVEAPVQ